MLVGVLGVSLKRSLQLILVLLFIGWATLNLSNKSVLYWEEANDTQLKLCSEEYANSVHQWKVAVKAFHDKDDLCEWK